MNGIYGITRPANMNPADDAEIYYYFRKNRGSQDDNFLNGFKKVEDVSSWLIASKCESGNNSTKLYGMYDLRLPLDIFNKKGIYTIYIKPKEIKATIVDIGLLANAGDTNVRGIIFNKSNEIATLNDISGYRIEYFDSNNGERKEYVRIITSCNNAEPVVMNGSRETRWNLTDTSSNYIFCTVTPSTANNFTPNYAPYIGKAGEVVSISNTKFNPVMIEVDMVEHDADTISYMLEGDQVRDKDNAIITTYNDTKEIYKQFDYYTIKDNLGNPLYDIKKGRSTIAPGSDYNTIVD